MYPTLLFEATPGSPSVAVDYDADAPAEQLACLADLVLGTARASSLLCSMLRELFAQQSDEFADTMHAMLTQIQAEQTAKAQGRPAVNPTDALKWN